MLCTEEKHPPMEMYCNKMRYDIKCGENRAQNGHKAIVHFAGFTMGEKVLARVLTKLGLKKSFAPDIYFLFVLYNNIGISGCSFLARLSVYISFINLQYGSHALPIFSRIFLRPRHTNHRKQRASMPKPLHLPLQTCSLLVSPNFFLPCQPMPRPPHALEMRRSGAKPERFVLSCSTGFLQCFRKAFWKVVRNGLCMCCDKLCLSA